MLSADGILFLIHAFECNRALESALASWTENLIETFPVTEMEQKHLKSYKNINCNILLTISPAAMELKEYEGLPPLQHFSYNGKTALRRC